MSDSSSKMKVKICKNLELAKSLYRPVAGNELNPPYKFLLAYGQTMMHMCVIKVGKVLSCFL